MFDCLSCLYNQQNHKTTKPQDNQPRFVWKTIPSEARVTRDEVSGFIKHKGTAVWKTVPPHERSIRVNPLICVRLLPQWFFEHGLSGLTRISLNHVLYVIDFEHGERARMHKTPFYPPVRGGGYKPTTKQQANKIKVLSSRQSPLSTLSIPRLRPGLLSLRSVLASSQSYLQPITNNQTPKLPTTNNEQPDNQTTRPQYKKNTKQPDNKTTIQQNYKPKINKTK